MKIAHWWIALIVLFGSLHGQSTLQTGPLEALLARLRSENGHILFPSIYRSFQKQLEAGVSGDSLVSLSPEVRNQLRVELETWVQISRQASEFLADVLEVRREAMALQAGDFAPEAFERAERGLQRAARLYHQNQHKKARQMGDEALELYRKAQAEAIRNRLLGEARIFLQESKDLGADTYAPRTVALVEQVLNRVETLLNNGRYDDPELMRQSRLLEEQAKHLLMLMQVIRRFQREKAGAEAYLLDLEHGLDSLSSLLDYQPRYSAGLPEVLSELTDALRSLKKELTQLREENRRLKAQNQTLRRQIDRLEAQLDRKQRLISRIERIAETLKPLGVRVEQQGNQLVLGVDNLPFAPGSSAIPSSEQTRLRAIVQALGEFPERKVTVQVTLVGSGNAAYNRNLARQRARALVQFFQSQLPIPDALIESSGAAQTMDGSESRNHNRVTITIQLPGD